MGPRGSKTPPPPPRQPLTSSPWRDVTSWTKADETKLVQDIQAIHCDPNHKPGLSLIGPVGAGKSSYINAVLSVGKGRKVAIAQTGSDESSFTIEYNRYTEQTLLKDYRLRDTMGIEPGKGHGFHVNDCIYLVRGNIKKGYTFNPAKALDEDSPYFNRNPSFGDKTHCVVFVVDARTMHAGISDAYMEKIRYVQDKMKAERIPRVLILPHADELCEEVARDVRTIFRSKRVREAVKIASEIFGIDQASIHPVKNYEVDVELRTEVNIPILLALRQMMQYAADKVEHDMDDNSD